MNYVIKDANGKTYPSENPMAPDQYAAQLKQSGFTIVSVDGQPYTPTPGATSGAGITSGDYSKVGATRVDASGTTWVNQGDGTELNTKTGVGQPLAGGGGSQMGFVMRGPNGEETRIMPGEDYNEFDRLAADGWTAIDPIDGHEMTITEAPGGGYLLDGAPASIISGQGWIEGQQEKLQQIAQTPPPGQDYSITPDNYLTPWAQPFESQFKDFSFDPQRIFEDPSYQFIRDEGIKGIERQASAGGRLGSGRTLKDLSRWNTGLASTFVNDYFNRSLQENQLGYGRDLGEYQQAYDVFRGNQVQPFNMLSQASALGLQAAGGINAAGTHFGNVGASTIGGTGTNLSNLAINIGDLRASGFVGGANAANQFNPISNLSNAYLMNRFL